jgi:Cu/Ag efflux pump CusA
MARKGAECNTLEVLSGAGGEVVVKLFGSDLNALDRKAEEVRRIVASVPGAVEVYSQAQSGSPEVTVSASRFLQAPTVLLHIAVHLRSYESILRAGPGNNTKST